MIGLITSPALAGVWTAQSTGGDSGKGCYLVKFNAGSYGNKQLIGTGVVSGNSFTGFLKFTANPQLNGTTYLAECSADGACVWYYASNVSGINSSGDAVVVSVSSLPITSAQAIACY